MLDMMHKRQRDCLITIDLVPSKFIRHLQFQFAFNRALVISAFKRHSL